MKGFIKQIIGEGIEELYWFPVDVEDEIITTTYFNFQDTQREDDPDKFETYWNNRNCDFQIERIFIDVICL